MEAVQINEPENFDAVATFDFNSEAASSVTPQLPTEPEIIDDEEETDETMPDNIEEEDVPIPEHLAGYVGMAGFATHLMRGADELQERRLRATTLSLIPGMDNSLLKEHSVGTYDRNERLTLPSEPKFCIEHVPEMIEPDLFGFKANGEEERIAPDMGMLRESRKAYAPEADLDAEVSASDAQAESGGGFITETIANIYVLQGAYQEAARAYAALAKMHPDKAAYFEAKSRESMKKDEDENNEIIEN